MSDHKNYEEQLEIGNTSKIVGVEKVIAIVRRYISNSEATRIEIKDKNGNYLKLNVTGREPRDAIFDVELDAKENIDKYRDQIPRLNEELEYIIKNYAKETFIESYEQVIYSGGISQTITGEEEEDVNTNDKIIVTYKMI